ncbi:MAG TPA: alpha/beta fold hydrolase [Stellaceae bacterium]|jgi:pimeloyl-ACP methyl ester carboxylesterase|nr:alpha/beta fold hydrolase [Stellaceae bacterium]
MADDLHPISTDFTVKKGDVSLAVYRKRLPPRPGTEKRPVLFLVHGSSNSGLSSFDLTVPGAGEYSTMNVFARLGFDVWTMDHENYGRSSRTEGNSDIKSGVADLVVATDLVVRETGQERLHYLGESSGALRAAAFAMERPERVGRLVLNAFTYTGRNSPTLAKRAEQVEYFRTHNRRLRDRAMIASIFTRDHPGTSDPAVAEALADAELVHGDQVPTGTYLDMTANLPVVDPLRVLAPVMLIRGEHDGIASEDDLLDFYRLLPNPDRQFVVLPGAAHALVFGYNRHHLWHVVHAFLTMPERRDQH